MSGKRVLSYVLSLMVSIVLIWILLSQIEIQDFITTFSNIYILGLFSFFFIHLTASWLRAWRYKMLLSPQTVRWRDIILTTFIRNLFVDLFPARIGSLSYIYVLNKRFNYSFESAASSFALAFVFDLITLGPFIILSIIIVGTGSHSTNDFTLLAVSSVFLFITFLVLWKIIPLFRIFLKFYKYLLRILKLSEKNWAKISATKLELTIESIIKIQERKIYLSVLFISFAIRCAKYGSLFFLLFALIRSHGLGLKEISFFKTILGITGAEITSFLPIKGIGGFGTWESAWALTLVQLGFESRLAILSSGIHLITNLFEYFLGISSIIFLASPLKKLRKFFSQRQTHRSNKEKSG